MHYQMLRKNKYLFSFTPPLVILNLYDYLSSIFLHFMKKIQVALAHSHNTAIRQPRRSELLLLHNNNKRMCTIQPI